MLARWALALAVGVGGVATAQEARLAQAGKPPAKAAPAKKAPAKKPAPKKKKKHEKQGPEDDLFGDSAPRAPKKGGRKGVRELFDAAQAQFDAGRFQQALAAYDALLRKYPTHEPAIIQTAKTLYRLDRIKEAYNVFARVNPQHLDPETSYEFGWSFYTMKQWEGALVAFQRVPKGHALFDLANYYGAICAIKLKKYEDAEDMLEKAVVLPDKLAKSRQLYIKHVQALRLMQQKSALAEDRRSEKNALAQKKDAKNAADPKAAPKESGEYKHAGFMGIDKAASASYATEHQYIDKHGLSETTFNAKVASFELDSGFLAQIPGLRSGKDRYGAAGLQLSLAAEDRITDGQEQRILIEETAGDLTRVQQTDLGTVNTQSGTVAAGPWIEFPLPEGVWLALGADLSFTYPEFERGGRYGTRGGYLDVAGVPGAVTYKAEVNYAETLDDKTEPTTTTVGGFVWVQRELMPKLAGRVKASYSLYDYIAENLGLDGPDSATRGEAKLTQSLPFGISAEALGAVEQQANFVYHGIEPYGQLSADGTAMTAKLTLKIAPFPWISAEVSELITKTNWKLNLDGSVDDQQAQDSFELNVPDYIEQFGASLSLNLAF